MEAYGCDDVLYNRTLYALFHVIRVPRATVEFTRRPGNSLDRQYEPKFSRSVRDARPTTAAAQRQLSDRVLALQERRQAEVLRRLDEPARPQHTAVECAVRSGGRADLRDDGDR